MSWFGPAIPPTQAAIENQVPVLNLGNRVSRVSDEGIWVDEAGAQFKDQIAKLEAEVQEAKKEAAYWKSMYEQSNNQLQTAQAQLQAQGQAAVLGANRSSDETLALLEKTQRQCRVLEFRNEVLLTMLTVSEGDFLQLTGDNYKHAFYNGSKMQIYKNANRY